MKPILTPEIARAAALDAGNASKRAGGRTQWNEEDRHAFTKTWVRLMGILEPDNPTWHEELRR